MPKFCINIYYHTVQYSTLQLLPAFNHLATVSYCSIDTDGQMGGYFVVSGIRPNTNFRQSHKLECGVTTQSCKPNITPIGIPQDVFARHHHIYKNNTHPFISTLFCIDTSLHHFTIIMLRIIFIMVAALVATSAPLVSAFTLPTVSKRPAIILSLSAADDIDQTCVENVAEFCLLVNDKLDQGCDIDEYEALVTRLQDKRQQLTQHIDYIDSLLDRLGALERGDVMESKDESYIAG